MALGGRHLYLSPDSEMLLTAHTWQFWSTSIVDGMVQLLGLFFLQETFAPILLGRRAQKMRKVMAADPEKGGAREIRTVYDNADRHWQQIVLKALVRPFKLFYCEPIAQLLGMYMAFVYGLLYRKYLVHTRSKIHLTWHTSVPHDYPFYL